MESREMAQTLLREFAQLFREGATRHMRDVSGGELGVLGYIHYRGDGVTPSDISREFHISTARVANVLNALERKEYIERRSDQEDRRKVFVRVTEAGLAQIAGQYETVRGYFDRLLTGLGAEDSRALSRLVGRCAEVMKEE